jgi:hypothetical protein
MTLANFQNILLLDSEELKVVGVMKDGCNVHIRFKGWESFIVTADSEDEAERIVLGIFELYSIPSNKKPPAVTPRATLGNEE